MAILVELAFVSGLVLMLLVKFDDLAVRAAFVVLQHILELSSSTLGELKALLFSQENSVSVFLINLGNCGKLRESMLGLCHSSLSNRWQVFVVESQQW